MPELAKEYTGLGGKVKELAQLFEDENICAEMETVVGQTSHTLRKALTLLTAGDPHLNLQAVWLLTTVCRSKERLLQAYERFPDPIKLNPVIIGAINFIRTKCVGYVSEERLAVNIATVHIPNTNPSSCLFWHKMIKKSVSGADLLATQHATQIGLEPDAQAKNKEAMVEFWNSIKKTRSKAARTLPFGFREEFYATGAADEYPLVWCDERDSLMPIWTHDGKVVYSVLQIEVYAALPKAVGKKVPPEWPIIVIPEGFRFKDPEELEDWLMTPRGGSEDQGASGGGTSRGTSEGPSGPESVHSYRVESPTGEAASRPASPKSPQAMEEHSDYEDPLPAILPAPSDSGSRPGSPNSLTDAVEDEYIYSTAGQKYRKNSVKVQKLTREKEVAGVKNPQFLSPKPTGQDMDVARHEFLVAVADALDAERDQAGR